MVVGDVELVCLLQLSRIVGFKKIVGKGVSIDVAIDVAIPTKTPVSAANLPPKFYN